MALAYNPVYAASQGKLGTQSTATVEISVTIHQSLNAISPNEILLGNSVQNNLTTSKPFCITNNGYGRDTNVPYELIVDRLESSNTDIDRLPFSIFLEDKSNKRLLTKGAKIAKRSNLKNNNSTYKKCAETGTKLSIKNNYPNNVSQPNTAGLLLLLVSPY
ncbi:MAG: hypothetical protein AB8B92_03095 [Gammaproteobacteria bacterium]